MGATLSNHDALDAGTANRAGLTLSAIDAEMVLEIAAAVDPIDAGAIAADALFEHLADG